MHTQARVTTKFKLDYNFLRKFWESESHSVNLGATKDQLKKQEELVQGIVGNNPKKVLDLGCGIGRLAIPLAKKGHFVTAIDYSKNTIQKLKRKKIDFLTAIQTNILSPLPFGKKFDIILIFGVIVHINEEDLSRLMWNAFKHLKHNGKLLIRESVGNPKHFEVPPKNFMWRERGYPL